VEERVFFDLFKNRGRERELHSAYLHNKGKMQKREKQTFLKNSVALVLKRTIPTK
jgi:hypothetical protein